MKLKKDFITQSIGDSVMLVAVGEEAEHFPGFVKCNKTAAFILEQLKEETTVEKILSAMHEKYDVSDEAAMRDINDMVDKLTSIGALI